MAGKFYKAGAIILGWYAANLLGVAASAVLSLLSPLLTFIPGMVLSTLIIGLSIGLAQWIVLRRVASISILWLLTIPVGLFLALKLSPLLAGIPGFQDDESVLSLMAGYAIIGLLVGLAQWIFLLGRFRRSWVWPLSSAAGLSLGLGLVLVTDWINRSGFIAFLLVALVYAVATGIVIAWQPARGKKTDGSNRWEPSPLDPGGF
jgi:hypothetical protein